MLQLGRPPGSLLVFLAVVVGIGAAFGHLIDMAGVALFLPFVSSISAKPAWKFWYDPPAKRETGRASCAINSYQRVGATSPKEIRQLPEHRFSKRAAQLTLRQPGCSAYIAERSGGIRPVFAEDDQRRRDLTA